MFDLSLTGDVVREDGSILKDAWLGVKDGRIAALSQIPLVATEHYDAKGQLLLPGFVDAHVHMRSNPDEGIGATTLAAAAGGTTTVIDMPFDAPARPVNQADVLRKKIADVNQEAIVDVALYATFARDADLAVIAELAQAGACGFKVSTIEVDPVRFPRIPDGQLLEAFQEIALQKLLVAAHQENENIVMTLSDDYRAKAPTDPLSHAKSRPPVAEAEAASRLLELAHWTGVHLHMVHGTIPRTFDLICGHKMHGTKATGETCIQYLCMTEDHLTTLGGKAKCNPPLRKDQDVRQLWEQLSAGKIDIVTSDHSPYALEGNELENIFEAAAGFPGVETLAGLLYSEGVAKGRIDLRTFVKVLALEPARIFGLSHKGRLSVGYDADIAVLSPDERQTIEASRLHYHVGWSPYEGWELEGKVMATFVRGQCVYKDGEVVGTAGTGQFVSPQVRG